MYAEPRALPPTSAFGAPTNKSSLPSPLKSALMPPSIDVPPATLKPKRSPAAPVIVMSAEVALAVPLRAFEPAKTYTAPFSELFQREPKTKSGVEDPVMFPP